MPITDESLEALNRALQRAPVLGNVHPLVPLCLHPKIQIVDNPREFIEQVDDQKYEADQPVLLLRGDVSSLQRFDQVQILGHPPIQAINENLPHHLSYVRQHLLTTHKIASLIESDVAHHQFGLVVVLLVDGLSYGDVQDWDFDFEPCFVDGPSVTYRLDETEKLVPSVGFASIIDNPSIAQRLYQLGYHNAFGYTYWRAIDNLVARYMFRSVAARKAENFEEVLTLIAHENLPVFSYVQIVREGLDGLAHNKRELRAGEIFSATQAIKDDLIRLCNVIQTKSQSAVVYVTADHGILWKNEHNWTVINQSSSKPRYSTTRPDAEVIQYTVRFENSNIPYYLYTYPYLGKPIRKNDSGVHGGLSYQESFVPFIRVEV